MRPADTCNRRITVKGKSLSRRQFLFMAAGASAGALATACAAPTSQVVEKPVEKIVEKQVVQTQVVEVEKIVTAPPPKERQLVRTLWWDNVVPGYREEPMRKWDETQDEYTFLYEWSPSYYQKLTTSMAGGQPPDLFIIEYAWLAQFLQSDVLLDIKPYIERDSYDLSDFPKIAMDSYQWKGGMYGLPDNITGWCLYYNKDLFDQAGVAYPTNQWDDPKWTTDDFLATCDKLTKRDASGNVTHWAFNMTQHWLVVGIWMALWGGGYVDNPMSPTKCTLDSQEAIDALQFYADLRNKYEYAPRPDAMTMGMGEMLQTERIAMDTGGGWGTKGWMQYGFPYDIGHFPKGPAQRNNYTFYYPNCIAKASKVQEGAWSLLKYYEDVAIIEIVEQGNLQGTKISHLEDIFLKDTEGAASRQVLVDSVKHFGIQDPLLTNWAEINNTITAELDPLWLGQKTAEECCKAAVAKANPLIAKGRLEG